MIYKNIKNKEQHIKKYKTNEQTLGTLAWLYIKGVKGTIKLEDIKKDPWTGLVECTVVKFQKTTF
jgi:hypothetical protein